MGTDELIATKRVNAFGEALNDRCAMLPAANATCFWRFPLVLLSILDPVRLRFAVLSKTVNTQAQLHKHTPSSVPVLGIVVLVECVFLFVLGQG